MGRLGREPLPLVGGTAVLLRSHGMCHRALVALALALFVARCSLPSRDEVAKVTSPDGGVVAVLIETNGGATTSFGYEIWLRDKNAGSGEQVGTLYGAVRNDDAYGANLRWTDDRELSVEYLNARTEKLEKSRLFIAGREVRVVFKPHVSDPTAPAGGMLFNLEREKQRLK